MDEMTTGTEVLVDDSIAGGEISDAEIDAAWDDEDIGTEESEAEADQPEAEQSEEQTEAEVKEDAPAEQTKEAEKTETADEWWKEIKVLGEKQTVESIEAAKALMQKGADYDRIRAERDQLKAEKGSGSELELFVKELASGSNKSVEQFMEDTRVRLAMARDKGLTEESARESIKAQMSKAKAEAADKARRDTEMTEFIREHPDVKGEDIPQQVWADFIAGRGSLKDLYESHVGTAKAKEEVESLRKEVERLKAEVEAAKENAANAAKSTGSVKSSGKSIESLIDKYWDD